MPPRPKRLDRLPEQYFGALLARVTSAAVLEGEQIVDLGRGNPETGPPQHVVDALAEASNRPTAHGYAPFRGLPELRPLPSGSPRRARARDLAARASGPGSAFVVDDTPGAPLLPVNGSQPLARGGSPPP